MEATTILLEIAIGIGKLFLHPLLYLGLMYSLYLGYLRVKRERKNFHIRVQDGWFELRTYWKTGLLLGLIFSIVICLVGYTVPFAFIVTAGILTLLFSLCFKPSILSSAYTAGITFFAIMAIQYWQIKVPYLTDIFAVVPTAILPGAAFLTGLLLLIEGILIYRNGSKHTSPKIIRSKRGLKVGIHESKRLWMVPLLFLIPEGTLSVPFDFWPVIPIHNESFTVLFIPYWFGFGQQIRAMLPAVGVRNTGMRVIQLGAVITIIAGVGFWFPIASVIAVAVAIIGRILVSIAQRIRNNTQAFYFSKSQPGIVVLDIIPDSPAEKMHIQIGEVIKTVNGIAINNEQEFYGALQRNRAYCKLEVIDINGENRFAQRALYEGEHHELGVIFVTEEKQWEQDVG
ncbi:PDZ domain-containing protein [Caldibacillus lycopersici]|uniref:PDZ domain-containing protein n=1 Tax=Perspicuibacillus lycopersici TaxID=1325689 RepID=A0AAE3LMN8_9BACI|nr:PDZ domain-containing protein [Perspicuibacillus lycopersici]MCU9612957.1 PDZ domain-containing protein [Perspicuibacillus lycopersici]